MPGYGNDTIKELGALAFASRLKRLSDRLARDISKIYEEHKVEFEARWFPVAFLLSQKSPLAVTEIAEDLQYTHPAVNQIAGQMEKAGLLKSSKDRNDDRRRLLSLTAKGAQTVKQLQPVWQVIRRCTEELLSDTEPGFLNSLDKIEKSLDGDEMYTRVSRVLYPEKISTVEIVDYKPRWAPKFRELNEHWLNQYFSIEPSDRKVLENPEAEILKTGGAIFFAKTNNAMVGTAALIRHSDELLEVAKMAVAPEFQKQGIGARLMEHMIHRARSIGAHELVLSTSSRLKAANNLYRKFGFRRLKSRPQWSVDYKRPTIYMSLKLSP